MRRACVQWAMTLTAQISADGPGAPTRRGSLHSRFLFRMRLRLQQSEHVDEFNECLRLSSFPRQYLPIAILTVEQFLETLIQGRRQTKVLPVLGQVQLDRDGLSHDSLRS